MTRPFEGIRVIDVTHVLAGPFAAYQLAVLGADVIKVEHPDDPDQSRSSGTDKALNRRNMGTGFLTQASNKRSIALDLKTGGGSRNPEEAGRHRRRVRGELSPRRLRGAGARLRGALGDQSAADLCLVLGVRPAGAARQANRLRPRDPGHVGHHGDDRHQGRAPREVRRAGDRLCHRHDRRLRVIRRAVPAREDRARPAHRHGDARRGDDPDELASSRAICATACIPSRTAIAIRTRPTAPSQTKDGLVMLGASNLRQQRRLWTLLERPDMIKRTNDERDADHAREIAVLSEIMLHAHRGRMGGIFAGPPRAGGARAQHGRGDRRSAACEPRRHSSPRHRPWNGGRLRRAARRLHLRPWRPAHRRAAAELGQHNEEILESSA